MKVNELIRELKKHYGDANVVFPSAKNGEQLKIVELVDEDVLENEIVGSEGFRCVILN